MIDAAAEKKFPRGGVRRNIYLSASSRRRMVLY
jgi:hypothetical protein